MLSKDKTCAVYRPVLFLSALIVACATLILIAAGGLVTSTESGLSVPDWPLSYGQWMPPMIGGIRFEHSHRLIAGTVGLLTFGLAILFWRLETRAAVRNLALAAFGAVVLQAVLGGITVIYLLPTAVSVAHACLGQTFFCIVSALALVTSRAWIEGPPGVTSEPGHFRRLTAATAAAVYLQLVLGAWLRHTGENVVWHLCGAFVVLVTGVMTAAAVEGALADFRLLRAKSRMFLLFILVQILLGAGAYFSTHAPREQGAPSLAEVLATTSHQAFGALVLATAVLMAVTAFGRLREAA